MGPKAREETLTSRAMPSRAMTPADAAVVAADAAEDAAEDGTRRLQSPVRR
jgi:hypothetical protein